MNGTGVFQKLKFVPKYLDHLKSLLNPNGQILIDSSDLRYMYDKGEDGGIWVPAELEYYGEIEYTVHYLGEADDPFWMLYLDETTLREMCEGCGLSMEIIIRGENFDYLARLST